MPGQHPKITVQHAVLALFISLISAIWGSLLFFSNITKYLESPFSPGEDLGSTVYNVTFFLLLIVAGSFFILIIYKYRRKLLKFIFLISIFVSSISIFYIYFWALEILLKINLNETLVFCIAIFLSLLFIVLLQSDRNYLFVTSLLIYGTAAGALFAFLMPAWSVVAVTLATSVFDIYSVFKGPLSKILPSERGNIEAVSEKLPDELKVATVPFKEVHLGMGDVVFYSMISSLSLISPTLSLLRWCLVSASLFLGVYLTLKFLEKRPVLPALPIPATLSIFTYLTLTQIFKI
ncbi:MAG TPA: hypothetical protein ENJ59_03030 [Thermofilum sp.]|nr:hypothetical protein [Thermofilum sp.]